jgi:hypothetical protein
MRELTVSIPEELWDDLEAREETDGVRVPFQLCAWARLGRAMEHRSDALERVQAALNREMHRSELSAPERAVYDDRIGFVHAQPGPNEAEFFAERQRQGPMIGYDEHGRYIRSHPDGRVEVLNGPGSLGLKADGSVS